MTKLLFIFCCLSIFAGCSTINKSTRSITASSDATPAPPVVKTQSGLLSGLESKGLHIFLGIPYAQAPLGPLRFLPPKPFASWEGIRRAQSFGSAPLQKGAPHFGRTGKFYYDTPISEDSLYLNVWTPSTPGPHPVFVWIFGGANISGATSAPEFDGSTFARDGIVFVSISYRVGAVGFLELGNILGDEYRESGNNALRDLALGLKWVKDNISAFGGDPSKVTVGGQSSGAKNTAALLTSPLTRGLFQQAIIDSGSGQTTHSFTEANAVTKAFLAAAHIPADTPKKILSLSPDDILAAQDAVVSTYPQAFVFRALTGGDFLPQRPVDSVREGKAHDIPLLIATCKDEWAGFDPPKIIQPLKPQQIANTDMTTLQNSFEQYAKLFPAWDKYTTRVHAFTAEEYWIPSIRLAEAQANAKGKVWMYRFDRVATDGWLAGYSGHGSDVAFVFDNDSVVNPAEKNLAKTVHGLWVSFITNGKASAPHIPAWPTYDFKKRLTELVSDHPVTVSDPDSAERTLWKNLLQ